MDGFDAVGWGGVTCTEVLGSKLVKTAEEWHSPVNRGGPKSRQTIGFKEGDVGGSKGYSWELAGSWQRGLRSPPMVMVSLSPRNQGV